MDDDTKIGDGANTAKRPTRRTDILSNVYPVWTWLVFMPFLAISTAFWGTCTILVAIVSHRSAYYCGTAWAWTLCRLNFTRVTVAGRDNIVPGQPYVILSNHQSNFDALVIYGHWGHQFRWVMKKELRSVPFLGWATAALHNVFIDRSDHARAVADMAAARPLLKQGISIIVFPEGTRNRDGRLQPFKKGGFVIAMELGLPILPVSIAGTNAVLPGKTLNLRPGRVLMTIHPPVPTNGLGPDDRDVLIEQVRSTIASGLPLEYR